MPARRPTILTADDDPQMLRLVAGNLAFEGYDVLSSRRATGNWLSHKSKHSSPTWYCWT